MIRTRTARLLTLAATATAALGLTAGTAHALLVPAPNVHINPCVLLPGGCAPAPTIPPIVKVNPCVIDPQICLPPPVTAPPTTVPPTTPTTTPPVTTPTTQPAAHPTGDPGDVPVAPHATPVAASPHFTG